MKNEDGASVPVRELLDTGTCACQICQKGQQQEFQRQASLAENHRRNVQSQSDAAGTPSRASSVTKSADNDCQITVC